MLNGLRKETMYKRESTKSRESMKCDELKQVEYPIEWGLYYDKSEVDEAIAELKARIQLDDDEMAGFLDLEEECGGGDLRNYIAELKQFAEDACLERDDNQTAIDELQAENRRLRRALWIARAERAIAEAEYWYGHYSGMYYIDATDVPEEEDNPYKRVKDTTIGWSKTWMNVESKCRAKAEEYK